MTSRRRDILWFAGLTVVCLFMTAFCVLCLPESFTDYGRTAMYVSNANYARALGVERMEYEAFVEAYGEPDGIEYEIRDDGEPISIATYPDLELRCCYWGADHTRPHLIRATIYGDQYRFGWLRIGVGSPRFAVRLAYLLDPPVEEAYLSEQSADAGYYGEDWSWLLFCFDERGRVETMSFYNAAF